MNRDLAFGVACLLLAAGYYALAALLPESLLADAVGPQGLPELYAVLLATLSIGLILRSITGKASATDRRRASATPAEPSSSRRVTRAAGMLLIGIVYLGVVTWIGYAVSIAALIMAATWYLGGALTRQAVAVAVGGAATFWLLFVVLLRVPFPAGTLLQLWP